MQQTKGLLHLYHQINLDDDQIDENDDYMNLLSSVGVFWQITKQRKSDTKASENLTLN